MTGSERIGLCLPDRRALAAALALSAGAAGASPLDGAALRGSATFRYLGLPVYEARLYTPGGAPFDWRQDFGLELTYLRGFTEEQLVESTLDEFTRMGAALPLRDQLGRCFRDVTEGDRYLAVSKGENRIAFWHNGTLMCRLDYDRIKTRFMSIFLGENARSRAFARRLRGE